MENEYVAYVINVLNYFRSCSSVFHSEVFVGNSLIHGSELGILLEKPFIVVQILFFVVVGNKLIEFSRAIEKLRSDS